MMIDGIIGVETLIYYEKLKPIEELMDFKFCLIEEPGRPEEGRTIN